MPGSCRMFLQDVEEAVVAYIDGAHWDDALRLVSQSVDMYVMCAW